MHDPGTQSGAQAGARSGARSSPGGRCLPALAAAVPVLRCPVCGLPMTLAQSAVRCGRGHSFDVARQGYLNLEAGTSRHRGGADTSAMVAARDTFLGPGHYEPIARAVSALAASHGPRSPGVVLDLAGGTGYYLAAVLDALSGDIGMCMDLSKPALRRAAAAHPRIAAIGRDVWQPLPVASESIAIAMSVFGPRNVAETLRVLSRDGIFLVVTPTAAHLAELVDHLGMLSVDPAKERRLAAALGGMSTRSRDTLSYRLALGKDEISALAGMGPSAFHIPPDVLESRIADLDDRFGVTISVTIAVYGRLA